MAMIDRAMKYCRTKDEFRRYMKRYGYDVKWQDNYKYITYTCPNNMKCRDIRLHEEKYRKENMELEFRLRRTQTKERYEYQQTAASIEYNDNRQRILADADKSERESSGDTGKYSGQNYYGESITVGNQRDKERTSISKKQLDDRDNGFRETGWEDERKYLFNGETTEEDGQYIGKTEKEMDTDIDWSTDSGANLILDSIYTLASATEIIRKPTTKIPRQTKNKKKGLGQREDDHSGDYQNSNELYYGQSM